MRRRGVNGIGVDSCALRSSATSPPSRATSFAWSSSSTETPRSPASLGSELTSGMERSRSQLETALSVTPIWRARSSCVMPLSVRRARIMVPRLWLFMAVLSSGFRASTSSRVASRRSTDRR